MYHIVALGESLIDFTPSGVNEMGIKLFSQNPGGAPANVLAMASKLGAKTAFIGKVGNDDFGVFLKSTMEQANIDTIGMHMDSCAPTTLAFVQLDDKGERSFTFYRKPGADIMLKEDEVDKSIIENCKIFHFGSVSLTDEPSRTATLSAVRLAKEMGKIVSYDPNYRPFLWESSQLAIKEIMGAMPLADVLKVSLEEMTLLTNETDIIKGAKLLAQYGPSVVVITMGKKGAYISTEHVSLHAGTYDVKTIDTTGAGDAFWGTLLFLISEYSIEQLRHIDLEAWKKIIMNANAAGSLTTTAKGAIPAMPNKEQIDACISNGYLL